jgi:hypothetical protein
MKIIDYMIVREAEGINEFSTGLEFLRAIKKLISSGWQPLGGVTYPNNKSFASQAMVRYES